MPIIMAKTMGIALRRVTSMGLMPAIPATMMVAPAIGDMVRPRVPPNNRHTEVCRMGRNRFVERKGRRIAGTGDQTQQEGTYGCADFNDRRIVDHGGDKRLDQTHSIHTGYEHACRQNDTDDIAVGFAHAVKERLGQRRTWEPSWSRLKSELRWELRASERRADLP